MPPGWKLTIATLWAELRRDPVFVVLILLVLGFDACAVAQACAQVPTR